MGTDIVGTEHGRVGWEQLTVLTTLLSIVCIAMELDEIPQLLSLRAVLHSGTFPGLLN
jgi:hypothetical protein